MGSIVVEVGAKTKGKVDADWVFGVQATTSRAPSGTEEKGGCVLLCGLVVVICRELRRSK